MRLDRLDLTRYGKFTDYIIDFGEKIVGQPDVHLIYGPNEAGKSTALAAFLDLLFGIEFRTRYNFLHDNRTMRIGAKLNLTAGEHELVRVKSQQNTLLNAMGQPVSDGLILGDLGSIDRQSYRNMFSLDDDILESGGEDIIASKGDVGQLLYAASAGVADLSKNLAGIRGAADAFYKRGSRSQELQILKQQLAELKSQRETIDTLASEYARLVDQRDRLKGKYEAAMIDRTGIQSRQMQIQRLLSAQPRLSALRGLREQLTPLAALPEAPPGWAESLPDLRDNEIELGTSAQFIADKVEQLTSELNGIVVDEVALNVASRMTQLGELRARHLTAEKDIPHRQNELKAVDFAISEILIRVERPDEPNPVRLLLSASHLSTLNRLIEARSGIEAAVLATQEERAKAEARLGEVQTQLEQAAGGVHQAVNDGCIAAFSASIAALRSSDHATRERLAARAYAAHLETLADRIRELRPWEGGIELLVNMLVPGTDEIERWKAAVVAAEQAIHSRCADVERLTSDLQRRSAAMKIISIIPGVVPDDEVARSRAAREQAWVDHRRTLDEDSAVVFELALRRDDTVVSDRHAHTAEAATLRQANLEHAAVEVDLQQATVLKDKAIAALQKILSEITAAIQSRTPGLPMDMQLLQWETWLQRRTKAIEVWENARGEMRLLDAARDDGNAALAKLVTAFEAAAIPYDKNASFEALLAAAQAPIEREAELKTLRQNVGNAECDLTERKRLAAEALGRDTAWSTDWAAACSACWLGEGGVIPPLPVVRDAIKAISGLKAEIDKRVVLTGRIDAMKQDQNDFAEKIATIATEMNLALAKGTALDTAEAIDSSVQNAKTAKLALATKKIELEEALRKQRDLDAAIANHEKRKTEITGYFKVETLNDVARLLEQIKTKIELREQAAQAVNDILTAIGLSTIEEAELALDQADRDALAAEYATLTEKFEEYDQLSRDISTAYSKAKDKIEDIGGDDAVAKIESKRRTIQLDIDDRAAAYLRLRLGAAAAEQALRIYRDQHRSSMMQHASSAFQTISRGAYARLNTHVEKDSEVLVAIGANGGSKLAVELSKGTRFQLYLALRVAGYHEFSRTRPSLPFIADDIMETFDDFRAEEAFRLFAGMANVGQVIYLTHHQHLIDIARRACPNVRVHELTYRP
jgi:uncharacterized protein YhaN